MFNYVDRYNDLKKDKYLLNIYMFRYVISTRYFFINDHIMCVRIYMFDIEISGNNPVSVGQVIVLIAFTSVILLYIFWNDLNVDHYYNF